MASQVKPGWNRKRKFINKSCVLAGKIEAEKMASSSANVQITVKPFDGTCFGNWEFRTRLLLKHYEVLDDVDMEPPTDNTLDAFKNKDLKATSIIVQCLEDNVLELVKNKRTARESQ